MAVPGMPVGFWEYESTTKKDHGNMKTRVYQNTLTRAGRWTAALLAAALLPVGAQESASLPSVSGHLTILNPGTNQNLSLDVQAQLVQQGFFYLPAGTVLVNMPGGEMVPYEVTELEFARLEAGGIIVGAQADITAVNRERDLTLRVQLFDEDAEAARQLPADYHLPFPPGDCVTCLKIGDTEYEAALLHSMPIQLKVEVPPSPPAE